MKKLSLLAALIIWGAFSLPVSAATVYQQLTDSSGEIYGTHFPGPALVGSFTVIASTTFTNTAKAFAVTHTYTQFNTGPISICIGVSLPCAITMTAELPPADGQDYFLDFLYQSGSLEAGPGQTYNIYFDSQSTSNSVSLRANLGNNFFYGYITNDGGESVPITAGSPGFTDVGISTTSQQVYCDRNFSTSTGFLSDVASDIGTAICNVGVFLFVPSSGAISAWQQLGSTTKTRIPFSYMYEVANDIYGLTASSSDNFIDVELDMSGWASSTIVTLPQSWTVLSTSTVSQYYPDTIRIIFRNLMATVLYLGFALWIYRKGQSALHSPV